MNNQDLPWLPVSAPGRRKLICPFGMETTDNLSSRALVFSVRGPQVQASSSRVGYLADPSASKPKRIISAFWTCVLFYLCSNLRADPLFTEMQMPYA